jgi:hypothetical protein
MFIMSHARGGLRHHSLRLEAGGRQLGSYRRCAHALPYVAHAGCEESPAAQWREVQRHQQQALHGMAKLVETSYGTASITHHSTWCLMLRPEDVHDHILDGHEMDR